MKNEDKKMVFLQKIFDKRVKIINFIYKYELLGEKINANELFEEEELLKNEIVILSQIEGKYELFKKLIVSITKDEWEWERLQPLVRAILIYGIYEMFITEHKVVINEMINIAKIYIPGSEYKLINKVLDIVSKLDIWPKK
ncbi:transcription antitermination factor NusB [Metamycoplasma hyosynoviae]|uniref:transcription antitermination factor NusB n=1 Tax=Metamycoplasma hyosynoviae TaxID=29559 RepID=UPI002359793E|nr:transcription antitermination factor NusB [Metamycoplasma hyosynoviae]MDC8900907.1 transcription antitermination factor NusB [Metamycoplasma hyosynoviae]MDC8912409.1 transcription antitermination factor NusB [Metamycoplasma hyosynoviae]MDC8912801.1 transcription antitermination factor NusB [Metamycoplasma hyosynoviae]MDC8914892.1 transcription antitermination factor NusB [Metamycoplasma hyosynoviae]MDD1374686.1 transcription antitermination factor NusB [Metamycoplasma hyosynoviae]